MNIQQIVFRTAILLIAVNLAAGGRVFAATCFNQVPTLTGDTSAVSTSGTYGSGYEAWKAFDSSNSSMWISETWETPAWIAYDWGSNRMINRYTITNTNGSLTSRAPKDFKLQGFNGSNWVTVDSRTHQTGWVSGTPRTYNVAQPGSYSKYRLHITDDNDVRSGVVVISIGSLELERCFTLGCPAVACSPGVVGSTVRYCDRFVPGCQERCRVIRDSQGNECYTDCVEL